MYQIKTEEVSSRKKAKKRKKKRVHERDVA